MRIGFVVPRCWPSNSHGRYVLELAQRLSRTEDVVVYSGALWPALRSRIQFRYLPVLDWPMLARLTTAWTASASLNMRHDFDVLHVQGADAPVSNVVTAHCCTAALNALGGPLPLRRRITHAVGARAEAYSLGKSSTRAVIAVSRKVSAELQQHYAIPERRLTVVSPGVDLQAFNPDNRLKWRAPLRAALGLSADDFVILFAGGNHRLKGLMPLVAAARRLHKRVKVVAVGVAPDRALARELDVDLREGRVHLEGLTAEIARYYAMADCFALPTLYDTFSLVTLEAMASGLPVIVSRSAGIAEQLTDGVDALLVDAPCDTTVLVAKVQMLMDDDRLRLRIAEAGLQLAQRHSWDDVTARTLQVYRMLCAA
jgi:glycosyltransferase involved in cell wall biosynthesis